MYRSPRWYTAIDETVVVGALPVRPIIGDLHRLGVRGVVNLCEEFGGHTRVYERYGMVQLRIPTIDFTCPGLEILKAVAFIHEFRKRGEKVYGTLCTSLLFAQCCDSRRFAHCRGCCCL